MWVLRHFPAVLGYLTLVPPALKALWGAVGNVGSVDFLVTHANDLGWMGDVIGWLLNPPGWSILPFIITGLGLIWWDVRRHRLAPSAMPVSVNPVASSPAPSVSASKWMPTPKASPTQSSPVIEQSQQPEPKSRADILPILSKPKPATIIASAPSSDVPNWDWSKLYAKNDSGNRIHLRFIPDSRQPISDSLLLIVYGYLVLLDQKSVGINTAHAELRRAHREAPNARSTGVLLSITHIAQALADVDFGVEPIDAGHLRRIRLSEGGYYELTNQGISIARGRAYDLIERA